MQREPEDKANDPRGDQRDQQDQEKGDLGDEAEHEAQQDPKQSVEGDLAGFGFDDGAQASERIRDAAVLQRHERQGEVAHQQEDGTDGEDGHEHAGNEEDDLRDVEAGEETAHADVVRMVDEEQDDRDGDGQSDEQDAQEEKELQANPAPGG